jgi:glycosyltransferase involved in cell wall biosynthesis
LKLIFKAPINSLSFGQVSYNLLKQFRSLGVDVATFPIGNSAELSAYKPLPEFSSWLRESIENRYGKLDNKTPCLSLWHLMGSEDFIGKSSFLYTFHEMDGVTEQERSVISMHDHVFASSSYSRDVFAADNCSFCPIGFDDEFKPTEKRKFPDDVIHFILIGKFEKRKNTARIIKLWAEKFGNNRNYQLTCLINNPFMKQEDINWQISKALNGKRLFNITFLPHLKSNSEVNDLINCADVDLSGLSGAEGWGIPAFTATALGKWSCVVDATAHKDWATAENSILVEPSGKVEAYDGVFFFKGAGHNQGNFWNVFDDAIVDAMERAEKVAKTHNKTGTLLRGQFTYEKTAREILSHIF